MQNDNNANTDAMRKAGFQFEPPAPTPPKQRKKTADIFGEISQPFNSDDRPYRSTYKPGRS